MISLSGFGSFQHGFNIGALSAPAHIRQFPLGGRLSFAFGYKQKMFLGFRLRRPPTFIQVDECPNIASQEFCVLEGEPAIARPWPLHHTPITFITSSPRWLITFTAIRPDFGFANGRDTTRFRLSQASSSISPFRVDRRAL